MAAVWMDIFKDEIEERVNAREQEARQDTTVDHIRNLMKNTQWPAERAMDALNIPQSQRATYAGLLKRV